MNRQDFQNLATIRLREAESLLQAGLYDGAYYLCGYVVECGLKACIAKLIQQYDFPEKERVFNSYSHDFKKLVEVAGLKRVLQAELTRNRAFARHWETALEWTETSRYNTHTQQDTEALYNAVSDPANGVLAWLQNHW